MDCVLLSMWTEKLCEELMALLVMIRQGLHGYV